jgi:hypothetical protein
MCHGGDITPVPLVTPYVNESDMASINEAFSADGSTSPWGFVHDGLDFFPKASLKQFRSACSGTVDLMQLIQNNTTSNWQVNLKIVCNPYVSNTGGYFQSMAIEYVFEPMSTVQSNGQMQLANIVVANGQAIAQGDVVGSLLTVGAGAHVHFSTIPFGSMLALGVPRIPSCPEPHFSSEAKNSSLNLLHVVWPSAGLCYFPEQGTSAILNLAPAWNLLGNSSQGSLAVATAFNDATKVNSVWKWISVSKRWAFYTPTEADDGATYAVNHGYDTLTTIDAGEGFWVDAKAAFTTQLPLGAMVTDTSFQGLSSGWHLIATGETKTPAAFNIDVPSMTLWAWDNAQSKWYFYAPSLKTQGGTALTDYITSRSYLDFTSASKTLGPGVGFWINKP